jgi:hypothetical protein
MKYIHQLLEKHNMLSYKVDQIKIIQYQPLIFGHTLLNNTKKGAIKKLRESQERQKKKKKKRHTICCEETKPNIFILLTKTKIKHT